MGRPVAFTGIIQPSRRATILPIIVHQVVTCHYQCTATSQRLDGIRIILCGRFIYTDTPTPQ